LYPPPLSRHCVFHRSAQSCGFTAARAHAAIARFYMTTNTTQSEARSGALEERGFRVYGFWCPRTVRPGRSCGTVDSTGVLPPDPTPLSGIYARCIPAASSGLSVNDHAVRSVPFACPEPRRAPPHPRKPSRFFPYWHEADTTEILIANPRLEFRLTAPKLSQLRISNRKKSAIFYPVFRRSAKIVLPPLFPSGRDSSPP
jgi:hypothetical protein